LIRAGVRGSLGDKYGARMSPVIRIYGYSSPKRVI
jgi:hypothetical protein